MPSSFLKAYAKTFIVSHFSTCHPLFKFLYDIKIHLLNIVQELEQKNIYSKYHFQIWILICWSWVLDRWSLFLYVWVKMCYVLCAVFQNPSFSSDFADLRRLRTFHSSKRSSRHRSRWWRSWRGSGPVQTSSVYYPTFVSWGQITHLRMRMTKAVIMGVYSQKLFSSGLYLS